ncbi:MAG: nickel-binding protein, partial [Actinomycetota bacterium]
QVPGVGSLSADQMDSIVQNSEATLRAMRSEGKSIRQVRSFATQNSVFCIYEADSEDLVNEHAKRAGLPANVVTPIGGEVCHDTSGK